MRKIGFIKVESHKNYEIAKDLFKEYEQDIGIDLSFQNFSKELQNLKQQYEEPFGGIILLEYNLMIIGCVAIRKQDDSIGELKRMYIQKTYRKYGLGKLLLKRRLNLPLN